MGNRKSLPLEGDFGPQFEIDFNTIMDEFMENNDNTILIHDFIGLYSKDHDLFELNLFISYLNRLNKSPNFENEAIRDGYRFFANYIISKLYYKCGISILLIRYCVKESFVDPKIRDQTILRTVPIYIKDIDNINEEGELKIVPYISRNHPQKDLINKDRFTKLDFEFFDYRFDYKDNPIKKYLGYFEILFEKFPNIKIY